MFNRRVKRRILDLPSHKPALEGHLLNTRELAKFLGCAPHTIEKWRMKHRGPKYIRMRSGMIRYEPMHIMAWLKRQCVRTQKGT